MPLTSCRTCGADISPSAKSCPHCGERHPGRSEHLHVLLVLARIGAVVFALWLAASWVSSSWNATSSGHENLRQRPGSTAGSQPATQRYPYVEAPIDAVVQMDTTDDPLFSGAIVEEEGHFLLVGFEANDWHAPLRSAQLEYRPVRLVLSNSLPRPISISDLLDRIVVLTRGGSQYENIPHPEGIHRLPQDYRLEAWTDPVEIHPDASTRVVAFLPSDTPPPQEWVAIIYRTPMAGLSDQILPVRHVRLERGTADAK
jgi:hypothetical protein